MHEELREHDVSSKTTWPSISWKRNTKIDPPFFSNIYNLENGYPLIDWRNPTKKSLRLYDFPRSSPNFIRPIKAASKKYPVTQRIMKMAKTEENKIPLWQSSGMEDWFAGRRDTEERTKRGWCDENRVWRKKPNKRPSEIYERSVSLRSWVGWLLMAKKKHFACFRPLWALRSLGGVFEEDKARSR